MGEITRPGQQLFDPQEYTTALASLADVLVPHIAAPRLKRLFLVKRFGWPGSRRWGGNAVAVRSRLLPALRLVPEANPRIDQKMAVGQHVAAD